MATRSSFNKNNSAIKRIMQEARELANDPCTDYTAAPLEDNLFEWHCTLRGAPETDFEGGLYHFRIILPSEYPFRPPSIMMLTPSGRFETNTKICISFTSYHEELWQPAWGVRTAIIGLQGFFPLKGQAAMGVGSLEAPLSERKRLAKLSREWVCPQCKVPNAQCLPDPLASASDVAKETQESVASDSHPSTEARAPSPCGPTTATSAPEPRGDSSPETVPLLSVHPVPAATPVEVVLVQEPEHTTGESTQEQASQINTESPMPEPRPAAQPTPTARVASRTETIVASSTSPSHRPPIVLDAAITVLLVLVAALLCRRLF